MFADCEITISQQISDPAWDTFVADTPGGHHAQTSEWARIKSTLGWKASRIIVSRGNKILGGAQVLIKTAPFGVKLGYLTKGPLIIEENSDLAKLVLQQVMQISKKNHCQLMAIQPPNNGHYLTGLLKDFHFRESNLELAPTATLVIDLRLGAEGLLKHMKQKTRQHIHQSIREGVEVCEGCCSDLDSFYSLYLSTAKRQGFIPYKRVYFDVLWNSFGPKNWISLMIACYAGEPISGMLLIPFGDTIICKMIGWSGKHPALRPNEALYWESILWGINRGFQFFDFEGVDPHGIQAILNGDPCGNKQDVFKYGFGGKPVLYPPAFDFLPNNFFSWAYHLIRPEMDGNSILSKTVEWIRKR